MSTFQASYKRLAREFFRAALRIDLPAHSQLDPSVNAAIHEFEAHVLGGWSAEKAFLGS